MDGESRAVLSASLVGLYLRGHSQPGAVRSRWPRVLAALRSAGPESRAVPAVLRSAGLWLEASILEDQDALSRSLELVFDRRVMTAADQDYPARWMNRLGSAAPPALWRSGSMPSGPALGLSGSRRLGSGDTALAADLGAACAASGHVLFTGGAQGADLHAVRAASRFAGTAVVTILPYGFERFAGPGHGCVISVCEPWAEFSAGQAMERNALVFAAGEHTLAVRPRWREGGTWTAAAEALRRRLSRVWVCGAEDDRASQALVSLGASRLESAAHLASALDQPGIAAAPSLFGYDVVREARLSA